jgi:hypothetical protein
MWLGVSDFAAMPVKSIAQISDFFFVLLSQVKYQLLGMVVPCKKL